MPTVKVIAQSSRLVDLGGMLTRITSLEKLFNKVSQFANFKPSSFFSKSSGSAVEKGLQVQRGLLNGFNKNAINAGKQAGLAINMTRDQRKEFFRVKHDLENSVTDFRKRVADVDKYAKNRVDQLVQTNRRLQDKIGGVQRSIDGKINNVVNKFNGKVGELANTNAATRKIADGAKNIANGASKVANGAANLANKLAPLLALVGLVTSIISIVLSIGTLKVLGGRIDQVERGLEYQSRDISKIYSILTPLVAKLRKIDPAALSNLERNLIGKLNSLRNNIDGQLASIKTTQNIDALKIARNAAAASAISLAVSSAAGLAANAVSSSLSALARSGTAQSTAANALNIAKQKAPSRNIIQRITQNITNTIDRTKTVNKNNYIDRTRTFNNTIDRTKTINNRTVENRNFYNTIDRTVTNNQTIQQTFYRTDPRTLKDINQLKGQADMDNKLLRQIYDQTKVNGVTGNTINATTKANQGALNVANANILGNRGILNTVGTRVFEIKKRVASLYNNQFVQTTLSALNTALLVHNAARFTFDAAGFVGTVADQLLGFVGINFQDEEGTDIPLNDAIGEKVGDLIDAIIPAEMQDRANEAWISSNNIFSAGANIFWGLQSINDELLNVTEIANDRIGLWMNTARNDGVVGSDSYPNQPPISGKSRFTRTNAFLQKVNSGTEGWTNTIDGVENIASSTSYVASVPLNVFSEVENITSQRGVIAENVGIIQNGAASAETDQLLDNEAPETLESPIPFDDEL
jgi:hypothetical protein